MQEIENQNAGLPRLALPAVCIIFKTLQTAERISPNGRVFVN